MFLSQNRFSSSPSGLDVSFNFFCWLLGAGGTSGVFVGFWVMCLIFSFGFGARMRRLPCVEFLGLGRILFVALP